MAIPSTSQNDPPRAIDRLIGYGDPAAIALVGREGALSYAELERLVARVSGGLAGAGLRPGDRVASWMNKTMASAVLPFASARAGLVHVPINPLLKAPQARHILEDSGARLLVTLHDRAASLDVGKDLSVLTIEHDWESLIAADPLECRPVPTDRLAALLYTSGSTGKPKGVMLSDQNLWLGAESVARYLDLRADDRVLALLPFSFDYGLNQMLAMFRAGGTVVLHDYLLARSAVKAMEAGKITVLAGVPPLWQQLLEVEWPEGVRNRLRVLTNSGGAMPRSVTARLRALCPQAHIHLMYGLTEAFRSTSLDPRRVDDRPDSVGTAIPHAEVLIVRPDGALAGVGEVGELVHCGPLVAQGYWRDAARTAERFRPAPSGSVYGGTAVWSGDQAVRDGEGLITFAGRDDEMIKTQGYRVSPTEVEEAALSSGVIAESAAFGVADERLGQAIHLVVRAVPDIDADEAERRLRQALRELLPNFMQPAHICWRQELPRNPNGKLDRALLKTELTL